ncbi:hypothetical protein BT93_E1876 [Corymbia citriodora subsp. variegata]|nr:hypothetical protein BT93_E1876 [Corymbia citriodora subsp. variegata]
METDGAAWGERFSPEVLGFMQIAIDRLDFEFDSYGAAIARELLKNVSMNLFERVFLCKFCLWMLGGEFIGNRHYTLQISNNPCYKSAFQVKTEPMWVVWLGLPYA